MNKLTSILTIDFKEAFDRMSHSFLFMTLKEYGISEQFCKRLQKTYTNATSTLTKNGHTSKPIKIKSGVRYGCPLSMLLFALCINPLLTNLENKLYGIQLGPRGNKKTVTQLPIPTHAQLQRHRLKFI